MKCYVDKLVVTPYKFGKASWNFMDVLAPQNINLNALMVT